MLHKKDSMFKLFRYKYGHTELARGQVQEIDEGVHSYEIENLVGETLETGP